MTQGRYRASTIGARPTKLAANLITREERVQQDHRTRRKAELRRPIGYSAAPHNGFIIDEGTVEERDRGTGPGVKEARAISRRYDGPVTSDGTVDHHEGAGVGNAAAGVNAIVSQGAVGEEECARVR